MGMNEYARIDTATRDALRAWLRDNYARTESVWLIRYKKHRPEYVPYEMVVEELLCWGWIDSLPRKLDADRSLLLISPRRKGSPWSGVNKRHIANIYAKGLMMPPGQEAIDRAKSDGSWTVYDEIEALIVPDDLSAELDANPPAAQNFSNFSDSSKKGILWWIKSAKRAPTRAKRIRETAELAAQNIKANHPR